MKIKIKKLNENAVIPAYAKPGDAGMDLTATSREWDEENKVWSYGTGLAFEIPRGYVGLVFPRSSVFKTGLQLTNCVGVIDSGYRGEVSAKFKETAINYRQYRIGERVAQIIILPYPEVEFEEVEELSKSERGEGGYGSTGK